MCEYTGVLEINASTYLLVSSKNKEVDMLCVRGMRHYDTVDYGFLQTKAEL